MSTCSKCGTEANTKFCPDCGSPMPQEANGPIGSQDAPMFTPKDEPTQENYSRQYQQYNQRPRYVKPKKPFYRRWWFITIIVILVLGGIGSALGEDDTSTPITSQTDADTTKAETQTHNDNTKQNDSKEVEKISVDNEEGTLTYTDSKVTKDYDGNPAVQIFFNYTNKQDEASSAQMTFYPQVFQNGVECDMGISFDDDAQLQNTTKDIQKGTTLDIAFIYELQDTKNPITLKISDQSSENLFDGIYQEQKISLK